MPGASELIEAFVASYQREYDFYQEASRLCAQRCERLLSESGIRGLVTYRAKRPDRLRQKILKRAAEREEQGHPNYSSVEEIRQDIVDLSGVRVALYFPGDRPKFNKLVGETFKPIVEREFPRPASDTPSPNSLPIRKRFTGYHATHHRVQLVSTAAVPIEARYVDIPTEIQVASVLMHAWSEVEHDLIYKPLSGDISIDEYAILDELNGLVLSGEIALELLQRAVDARVGGRDALFSNQYELAAILFEEAKALERPDKGDFVMGRVDLLFRLLASADLNRADDLRPFIAGLHGDTEARPLADQVIDAILGARPELYDDFLALRDAAITETDGQVDPTSLHARLLSQLIAGWRKLDLFARIYGQRSQNSKFSARDIPFLLEDPALSDRFRRLRSMRDAAIHGPDVPTSAALSRGVDELETIFAALAAHDHELIRESLAKAQRSGLSNSDAEFATARAKR